MVDNGSAAKKTAKKKSSRKRVKQVERRVKFYELRVEAEPDENNVVEAANLRIDPPVDVVRLVDALDAIPDDQRIHAGRHGMLLHGRVHQFASSHVFALSRVRVGEGGLLFIDTTTGVTSEYAIPDEQGFAEEAHIAFFDDNVVGVVSNGQGAPGPTRIEEYLNSKLDWDRPVVVVPIEPENRLTGIENFNTYTRQAVARLPAQRWDKIPKRAKWYREVMQSASQEFGPDVRVRLEVKVPTHGAKKMADKVFNQWKVVAGSDVPDQVEITYQDRETEKGQTINLLHDILALGVGVTVVQDDGGNVARVFSELSTSDALKKAYDDLRDAITEALKRS